MKTSANTNKPPVSRQALLEALAGTFPYKELRRPLSRNELAVLASASREIELKRRESFEERLCEFRKSGESLRSFPMSLDTAIRDKTQKLNPDDLLGFTPVHVKVQQQAQQATVDDPFPFEAPPIMPTDYFDIPVDNEYDLTANEGIDAYEGQPDVHDWSGATEGSITKIGFFPYRFKKNESKTHLIRIGTKDHWGVDLERVVREFKLKEGDRIALKCIGKQPVIVSKREQQLDGTYAVKQVEAMRNTWVCKRL